jgi:hypothetical protein
VNVNYVCVCICGLISSQLRLKERLGFIYETFAFESATARTWPYRQHELDDKR